MKKMSLFFTLCFGIFLLTGCWDQRLLKESSLILGAGLDLTKDQKIEDTFFYPKSVKGPGLQQKTILVSAKGDTIRDAREHANRKTAEKLDASKNRFCLLGKDLAAHGIYAALDMVYRDAKGASNAKVAVVNGLAKDALFLHATDTNLASEYYPKLLASAETSGFIKNHTVQALCSLIFADGKDFMVPYITLNKKERRAYITGLAMFHHDKFVGTLNGIQSKMFLLLTNTKHPHIGFKIKIDADEKKREKNFIYVQVNQLKPTIHIRQNQKQLRTTMDLDIAYTVTEYGKGKLTTEKKKQFLNHKVKKHFTQLANQTLLNMQRANCDGLGIGERVQAYHMDAWKHINWDKAYPHLPIKIRVHTKIENTGVIH
ncbi:Ger(x)C family spore germination protein [Bacillus thuringiensis]|uniref:Ger(x)C family spore germination protein n=1 Tax=Bacillus thuringiensis TaxID=1428 RepID=UPI0015CF5B53|nr:Ger(x)C family spore germination protein [Bacillus thuringiensis]